jgi:CHAT domain-containing protein/Tfp pilus assembly protein PilF
MTMSSSRDRNKNTIRFFLWPRAAIAVAICVFATVNLRNASLEGQQKSTPDQLLTEARDLRKQGTSTALRGALEKLHEAIELFESHADQPSHAAALNEMGEIQFALGQVQEAFNSFERLLPLRRALRDTRGEGETLNSIGVTLRLLGDPRRALTYYGQALPLLRAAGDRVNEAQTLSNSGVAHAMLDENREALNFFEQALPLRRVAGDRGGEAQTLHSIGGIHYALGDYQQALRYALDALPLRKEAADRSGEAQSLQSIGLAYQALSELTTALKYYNTALVIRRAIGDQLGEGYVLHSIGDVHMAMRQHRTALDYFEQALPLRRTARDPRGEADTLHGLGLLYLELGDTTRSLEQFDQSLQIRRRIGNRRGEASTLVGQARVKQRTSRLEEARADVEAALAIHESLRADVDRRDLRDTYLATSRSAYELYVDVLMRLNMRDPAAGHDVTALAISERARARSLLETLAEARAEIRPEIDARTIGAAEIQRDILDDDSLLLEYLLGEDRSFVWAVTSNSIVAVELPRRAVIEAAARRLYGLWSARPQRQVQMQTALAAAELSRLVLGPVANRLGRRRLLIVPDGALHYIPFAAIPAPSRTTAPAEAAEPLIVRHEVVTLPSASTLAIVRRDLSGRTTAPNLVAVVADPVFNRADPRVRRSPDLKGSGAAPARVPADVSQSAAESGVNALERLPFARREAESIERMAASFGVLKAVDFDASRETVTSPQLASHRIVHFATHGLLNNEHPELSGIVLSLVDRQGQPQDGFLRLRDIYKLRLGADLVVLSACRTALGKDIRGEGVVGLTRGFMYAGARSVVASLWDARDEATSELMARLYSGLLKAGLAPSAALRSAQLSMLRDPRWRAPYYWAAFTLQGEWTLPERMASKPGA